MDGPNNQGSFLNNLIYYFLAIIIQGRMLDERVGIYALRLYHFDGKTDIHKIGPEMIDFDK
jgi:hypothetical protein